MYPKAGKYSYVDAPDNGGTHSISVAAICVTPNGDTPFYVMDKAYFQFNDESKKLILDDSWAQVTGTKQYKSNGKYTGGDHWQDGIDAWNKNNNIR